VASIKITEPTVEDTQTKLIAKRSHDRDETQVWLDGKVADLVKRYHEAGDPEAGESAPFLRLAVKKEERADLRTMINRAFILASVPENAPNVAPWFYFDAKGSDGEVIVKFNVQPKPLTKAEREAQEKAQEEAQGQQATDQEGDQEGDQAGQEGEESPNPSDMPQARRGRFSGRS
jgi:hypothetical protein